MRSKLFPHNASSEEHWLTTSSSCMRRLQGNLTYLASLADRKVSQPQPPCPAYLTPPPLNLNIKMRAQTVPPADPSENLPEPNEDRKDRNEFLKELYDKLQALFPGFDPKKEPAFPMAANRPQSVQNGQRPGGPGAGQNSHSNQGSPAPMVQAQQPNQQRSGPPVSQAGYIPQGVGAS